MAELTPEERSEFVELKKTVDSEGFMALNTHDKRNRYRELKAKDEGKMSEEIVTISKLELQDMMDKAVSRYKTEINKLQDNVRGLEDATREGQWRSQQSQKKRNHVAALKIWREDGVSEPGVVIDWKFLRNDFNEETRRQDRPVYKIWVRYGDEVKNFEIDWQKFASMNEYEIVEIIKQHKEKQVMSQGKVRVPVTSGHYWTGVTYSGGNVRGNQGGAFTPEVRDLLVSRDLITVTVKRPNGDTLELNADRLNP